MNIIYKSTNFTQLAFCKKEEEEELREGKFARSKLFEEYIIEVSTGLLPFYSVTLLTVRC